MAGSFLHHWRDLGRKLSLFTCQLHSRNHAWGEMSVRNMPYNCQQLVEQHVGWSGRHSSPLLHSDLRLIEQLHRDWGLAAHICRGDTLGDCTDWSRWALNLSALQVGSLQQPLNHFQHWKPQQALLLLLVHKASTPGQNCRKLYVYFSVNVNFQLKIGIPETFCVAIF